MKAHIKYIVAFLAAMLTPLAVQAQEFSADTVTHDASGKTFRGKLYRNATMIRAEGDAASSRGGDPMLVIVDIAKQVSYSIVPSSKTIMVAHGLGALNKVGIALPVNENPCTFIRGGPPPAGTSCQKLGEEMVNGRHATKWEVTDVINGHAGTQVVWVHGNLHSAVKLQFGPFTEELLNIREGPQPASLFELPSGYRQLDVGGR
jgi:hypothetical protein